MEFRSYFRHPRALTYLHICILTAACFLVYSNNYRHDYHLDSSHTIKENTSIRTMANIPFYFSDPSHFSKLRSNVDYRPVLLASYALNYWMGGYDTWWWHFTQILIHLWCAVGLYSLAGFVLNTQWPELSRRSVTGIALLVALLFCVHPTGSGVVNYLAARSSLLTAAFLFTSLNLYFHDSGRSQGRLRVLSSVFFGLGLFTKVEALACLAAFFLYEMLRRWKERERAGSILRDFVAALDRRTIRHLRLHVAIGIVYLAVRFSVMTPYAFAQFSRSAAVGPYSYFLTQLSALWHYILTWFAPVHLVADDLTFPVHHSLLDAPVLLAIAGWLLVLSVLAFLWREYAPLVFLALSAYALITPTSSVVPLSEMVNEHRPYMPLAILSLVWLLPAARACLDLGRNRFLLRVSAGLSAFLLFTSFAGLTYERNRVFETSRSYWEDVVRKAPSSRAYLNYGLTYMAEANWARAEGLFLRSLELAPYWTYTHINLALVYENTNRDNLALDHYYKAVQFDHSGSIALAYRGEYYTRKELYRRAVDDFERARETSLERYRIAKGLATAYAGLGDPDESVRWTRVCIELDREQALTDIVPISRPFWQAPSRYKAGILYYEDLTSDLPNEWWVYYNVGGLRTRIGDLEGAKKALERAERLKGEMN